MEAKATHKYARTSASKARLVIDQIRGLPAVAAVEVLKVTRKRASGMILKVLKSAMANAGYDVDIEKLWVKDAHVDEGPTLKRWIPRSRGMANPILKRTSHISITLSD